MHYILKVLVKGVPPIFERKRTLSEVAGVIKKPQFRTGTFARSYELGDSLFSAAASYLIGCPYQSTNFLKITWFPTLVEKRFCRAVEPEKREPAFAGHGSEPI